MSECPYCQNTFEMTESCSDEFRMWQGLVGPYYIPSVDGIGTLTWTNTGELPNPDPVNISASAFDIVGIVETTGDLPESANDFDVYLVGEEEPFSGYIWDGSAWVDLGVIGKGDPGEGVPPGGTTGQVLAKASGTDYDTQWVDQSGGDPATATPLMDGTAAVGTSTKYARSDHVHPLYNQFVRPNLLDNWYFVGGGSQQGGGQFPINQRGQASYNGSGYSIDRWYDSSATSVTVGSSYVTFSNTSNKSGRFTQKFANNYYGETVTLSALINGGKNAKLSLQTQSGTEIGYASASGVLSDWTLITSTFTVSSSSNLQVVFYPSASDTGISAQAKAFKLELGTTQTLAHQENGTWVLNEIPDYSEQLYRCCASTIDTNDTYANNPYFVPSVEVITLDTSLVSSQTASIARYGRLRVLNIAADMINSGDWQTVYTLASKDRPKAQLVSIAGGYGKQVSEVFVQTDGLIQINAIETGWLKSTAIWIV